MEKLPKGFKAKWIKALESGKYKKGYNELKRKNYEGDYKYCCLGVAAEICNVTRIKGGYLMPGNKMRGLKNVPIILLGNYNLPNKLAILNDKHTTFKPVINYIKKHL